MHSIPLPIVTLFMVLCAFPIKAAEPQISFAVNKRWVQFTLTHDDKPLANGMVRVIDGFGNTFAEGETGANGQGEFPLPIGHQFRVEIKIGDRTADMISVTSIAGNRVVPDRVLLSYGLAPCCRIVSRSSALVEPRNPATPLPPLPVQEASPINAWVAPSVGLMFLGLGAVLVGLAFKKTSGRLETLAKEPS